MNSPDLRPRDDYVCHRSGQPVEQKDVALARLVRRRRRAKSDSKRFAGSDCCCLLLLLYSFCKTDVGDSVLSIWMCEYKYAADTGREAQLYEAISLFCSKKENKNQERRDIRLPRPRLPSLFCLLFSPDFLSS